MSLCELVLAKQGAIYPHLEWMGETGTVRSALSLGSHAELGKGSCSVRVFEGCCNGWAERQIGAVTVVGGIL